MHVCTWLPCMYVTVRGQLCGASFLLTFMQFLGIEPRRPDLHDKRFTHWTISLAHGAIWEGVLPFRRKLSVFYVLKRGAEKSCPCYAFLIFEPTDSDPRHTVIILCSFKKRFIYVYMYACILEKGIWSHYRRLWVTMWLQGMELRTSGRASEPSLQLYFMFLYLEK